MAGSAEKICVVIGRTRHKMVQIEIQEAAKRGARMIEVRLDFLAKAPDFKRLLENKPCPLVATVRRPVDGGRWAGSEEDRRMLLRQTIVGGFDWVDLEMDVAEEIRRFKNVKRIVSYHNLREMPADLEEIYARMCEKDADVLKVAVLAQSPSDNLRVLGLLKNAPKPTVAFCMGDMGFASRILGGKFGVPFTYAAFNKERGVAPGIPSFDDMLKMYRFDTINADTEIFGVIGDPVGHSLSPLIHNAGFEKVGRNAVYLPFRVPRGKLTAFLKDFDSLPVKGYSVTIPHKEAAAANATTGQPEVTLTGAANTLIRTADGFAAYNTDYQAGLDSLTANLPQPKEGGPATVVGLNVLVLGAGGVARALAQALHRSGAIVVIANRSSDRAQDLAADVGCRCVEWETRHNVYSDILINATSVGMQPNLDETPIHQSYLREGLIVFDAVYTPEQTFLIKQARQRGCHTITGVDMFVRQACLQFKLFTGAEPPFDLMRQVVKRALSPVALRDEEA